MNRGIYITELRHQSPGAVVMAHCPECRRVEIFYDPWAAPPKDGDLWKIEGICLQVPQHNFGWEPPLIKWMWPKAKPQLLADEGGMTVREYLDRFLLSSSGQDVVEYAIMLAVLLVVVLGTARLIGSNASNVFSSIGSAIQ